VKLLSPLMREHGELSGVNRLYQLPVRETVILRELEFTGV